MRRKKYVVKKNKKKNEFKIEYHKVSETSEFRYHTLKQLLKNKQLIVSLETNLVHKNIKPGEFVEKFTTDLKSREIKYFTIPTPSTRQKSMFGIALKSKEVQEIAHNIVFELNEKDMTREFFDAYLKDAEIIIGIAPLKSFNSIEQALKYQYSSLFPENDYFEDYYFDSITFCAIRTSLEVNI